MKEPGRASPFEELMRLVIDFSDRPEWAPVQTPANLAIAISCEAAELLELFKWRHVEEPLSREETNEVARELADVLIYCLQLAQRTEIDVATAVSDKIRENYIKYPRTS